MDGLERYGMWSQKDLVIEHSCRREAGMQETVQVSGYGGR